MLSARVFGPDLTKFWFNDNEFACGSDYRRNGSGNCNTGASERNTSRWGNVAARTGASARGGGAPAG